MRRERLFVRLFLPLLLVSTLLPLGCTDSSSVRPENAQGKSTQEFLSDTALSAIQDLNKPFNESPNYAFSSADLQALINESVISAEEQVALKLLIK